MSIITFLEQQIDESADEYANLVNRVRDRVINPLRGNVDLVTAGHWKGQGANRFINEINDEVLPMLEGLFAINMNFVKAIKKSEEHMELAIQTACAQSASLMDEYLIIF